MLFQIKPHLQVQASVVRAPSASSTRQDSFRPGVKNSGVSSELKKARQ
jgi:hypothetical protein